MTWRAKRYNPSPRERLQEARERRQHKLRPHPLLISGKRRNAFIWRYLAGKFERDA